MASVVDTASSSAFEFQRVVDCFRLSFEYTRDHLSYCLRDSLALQTSKRAFVEASIAPLEKAGEDFSLFADC